MSNSNLVDIVMLSPNSSPRTAKIDTITIHHMATVSSAEACATSFLPTARNASANYCIGNAGDVALSVEESRRSYCSSNRENDNRAITIEVSNSERGGDWPVSDAAMNKLLDLCEDICKRNGIPKLNFTGDKSGNVTFHNMFANTLCPGPFIEGKINYIVEETNRRLSGGVNNSATTNPPKEDNSIPGATDGPVYRVQVGAFLTKDFALKLMEELKEKGYDAFVVKGEENEGNS